MLLYEAHLDTCDGDNEDFNFELVVDGNDDAAETDDGGSNKINIMDVIKSELPDHEHSRQHQHLESDAIELQHDDLHQQLHHHEPIELHDHDMMSEQVQYLEEHLV